MGRNFNFDLLKPPAVNQVLDGLLALIVAFTVFLFNHGQSDDRAVNRPMTNQQDNLRTIPSIDQLANVRMIHGKKALSVNQSKQICLAPCVGSESEAHTGRHYMQYRTVQFLIYA